MVAQDQIQIDAAKLGECRVKDAAGTEIPLRDLWSEHPAILIFLRHFACVACRAHAEQVWANRAKYEQGGARIAFIGNGTSSYLKTFIEDLGALDVPIYTDPTVKSFAEAGFKRGFLASHGARSIANVGSLLVKGHRPKFPSAETGDVWQLGGIVVVKPGGRIAYHYVSEAVGDFPPENDEPRV